MSKDIEGNLVVPSPIKTIENASRKNPLFIQALKEIKDPEERASFLGVFRNYLESAYANDPKMKRLMKTHDIGDKVLEGVTHESYDDRSILNERLYSEPGRTYDYTNSMVGQEKEKKGLLGKIFGTTAGLTFETLPGIVGGAGLYKAGKWHAKRIAEEAAEEALVKRALREGAKGAASAFEGMKWYEYISPFHLIKRAGRGGIASASEVAGEVAGEAASDTLLSTVGMVLTPAKYLLGGYFLYKTLKYFTQKRKESKEREKLESLNKRVWLQNQLLAQKV